MKKVDLEAMRHSCEHVLTQAMISLYPGLLMAMGPATEEGFYFDFEYKKGKISEADFPKIEQEMKKIIKENLPFKRQKLSVKQARQLFKNNPYKQEWLDEIEKRGELAVVYGTGSEFVDLCSGPHLKSTGKIGPFKLLSIAGAYWRGDEKNPMLTRIYGTCFPTQKELDQYLKLQEEAKKRDHRKLGKELEFFIFDEEFGPGLALWLPKGAILRRQVMEFALETYLARGYQLVSTPHIARLALWQKSGHWDFYRERMYSEMKMNHESYVVKPMNCPGHVKIFQSKIRSYKDLPIRYTEMGTVYRWEESGVLHGLTRVRGFTQDDAHIFCTPEQLKSEILEMVDLTKYILAAFGFKEFEISLSVHDPKEKKKYLGNEKDWNLAERALEEALKVEKLKFTRHLGEAVFYGPKIDFLVKDAIGRKWQLTTIQVDFNFPKRFNLSYIGADGKNHRPIMLHRALLGSLERFIGILIEHYACAFPVWLAPVQVVVIPIAERHVRYAQSADRRIKTQNMRTEVDERSETVEAKIRDAELQKIPYMLIVGDREIKRKTVSVRQRGEKELGEMKIEDFLKKIKTEIERKR